MHSSQLNLVTLAEANNRWIWWKLCWCCQCRMASHKGRCDSRRQSPDEARHQRIHKSSAGPLHPLQIDWQNTSHEYLVIQTVLTTKQVQKINEFCYPLEWLDDTQWHHSLCIKTNSSKLETVPEDEYLWDNFDIDPPQKKSWKNWSSFPTHSTMKSSQFNELQICNLRFQLSFRRVSPHKFLTKEVLSHYRRNKELALSSVIRS